jgi:AmmeMemoRadiSam system protein B
MKVFQITILLILCTLYSRNIKIIKMESNRKRKAAHAPDWYTDDKDELDESLKNWLSKASSLKDIPLLKAIIGPHAGYSYSGSTAAWAYININPLNYTRVFLLGPSHHKYLAGCGIPVCGIYETPLGDIKVDAEIVDKLSKVEGFIKLTQKEEEKEHSLEMHLPYIKKVFGDQEFTLVPIMVGNLNTEAERVFGKVFAEFLKDDKNLFIISSDFCHWGSDFDYTYYDKSDGQIHESIEKLDKEGIGYIESQDFEEFAKYLEETDNTICGRHPIGIFLNALKYSGLVTNSKLLHYKQSSKVNKPHQSSVSYAAIATYLINKKI